MTHPTKPAFGSKTEEAKKKYKWQSDILLKISHCVADVQLGYSFEAKPVFDAIEELLSQARLEGVKGDNPNIMVFHGSTSHQSKNSHDCLECLDMEIELLQDMREAGGKTKFLASLSSEGEKA